MEKNKPKTRCLVTKSSDFSDLKKSFFTSFEVEVQHCGWVGASGMPQSLVWVARHAFPAVHDWAFPGRSYCGAWGRVPWCYLMGLPCPCPLTARHLQLPVSCRVRGPLSGLCLLQFWLLIVCVNTGGHSGPLALMHWVACGGLMARQCWTVLYHGAFDSMACLAHCVQPLPTHTRAFRVT